jgi:hypothetical protein
MNRIGDAHPGGMGHGFDSRRDVDAVAIEIIALDDHVAGIDADAQFDAAVSPDTRVPRGHRQLDRDRAAHRVDDARKFPPAWQSHLVDCGGARPAYYPLALAKDGMLWRSAF